MPTGSTGSTDGAAPPPAGSVLDVGAPVTGPGGPGGPDGPDGPGRRWRRGLRRATRRTVAVLVVLGALGGGALASWRYLVEPDPDARAALVAAGAAAGAPCPAAPATAPASASAAPAAVGEAAAFVPAPPADPPAVRLRVWNSTRTSGLAGRVGDELVQRGFVLSGPAADDPARGERPGVAAEVRYGREGAGAAQAVAAHVPDALPALDRRRGAQVDLVLHEGFERLRSSADAAAAAEDALAALAAAAAAPRAAC